MLQNPIRKIPGPPGLPIVGNVLTLNVPNLKGQFYEMAERYGPVMKVYIFNMPVVILNTTEVCLEALVKTGLFLIGVVKHHEIFHNNISTHVYKLDVFFL